MESAELKAVTGGRRCGKCGEEMATKRHKGAQEEMLVGRDGSLDERYEIGEYRCKLDWKAPVGVEPLEDPEALRITGCEMGRSGGCGYDACRNRLMSTPTWQK